MRHLALLAAAYLLVVALVLPTSLSASEEQPPREPVQAVETAPEAEAPEAVPVPEAAPAPAPAPAPEPAAPAPEPEDLGVDNGPEQRATAAASTTVTIKDFEFSPAKITVSVGDTVTWNNDGPTAHSATASDGSFDTGVYGKGQSRSHTFAEAGTFAYVCTPHPFMKGTVTVEAASSGGGGGDADGGAENARGGASDDSSGGTSSSSSDTGSGSSLPATGSDTARLLAFGLLLLALGVAVRRRASAG